MNFLLYTMIDTGFNILQLFLLARVILSWFPHDPYNQIIHFIYSITEPMMRPIRDIFPMAMGGVDFSPIIVFFLIGLLKKILLSVV